MEVYFRLHSRCTSLPYSYTTSPPPASPIVDLSSLWEDDRDSQTTSSLNPNYSIEPLISRFSGLNVGLSYNPVVGVNTSPRPCLPEPMSVFSQATNYLFPNRGAADVYDSSSFYPSSSSNNLLSRGSFGSFSTSYSLFGGEMSNGGRMGGSSPCGTIDCSCQYNYAPIQLYQQREEQQLDRHTPNFTANVHNGPRAHSRGFMDDAMSMNNRRRDRQRMEFDTNNINLMDLRESLMSWVTDQNLCRILMNKIQDSNEEEIEMVVSEVIDHASDLMMHFSGNYFMQKLIDVCGEEQRSRLLFSIIKDSRQLKSVCCNNHGTRCIQRLLESLKSPLLFSNFVLSIRPSVVPLIKDMNGYHVIQHCLNSFAPEQNKYIIREVVTNFFDLARDINGCRVIQQCIDNSYEDERSLLLSETIDCALLLSEDRYGNYVVQRVLDLNDAEINRRIQKRLTGNFASLSRNKFGSHVVEKCMTITDFFHSSLIIVELMQSPMLLVDPFGNFVMQAALVVAQGEILMALFNLIEERLPTMLSNMYGRKVIEAYKKRKTVPGIHMYFP